VPAIYDRYLATMLFEPYAIDTDLAKGIEILLRRIKILKFTGGRPAW
jgi:hypothetical protein